MNNLLPPPPPRQSANANGAFSIAQIQGKRRALSSSSDRVYGWEIIQPADASQIPCQRSLHAGAVWRDYFVVFGGYDGLHRVNDLHAFHFPTSTWRSLNRHNAPSPRDRHVAVVYDNSLYIFGGFDGSTRVNDLHRFNLESHTWEAVVASAGNPPTPRHSHSAVLYRESMYIFGGYDGSYRSDFHSFHFPSGKWRQVNGTGDIPRARYRGTCVVFPSTDTMILHGGHDGTRHLQDTHLFDFVTETWFLLATEGPAPQPRDSHVSVIHGQSMYLYGGSTGSAMGDFHELRLEFRRVWSSVDVSSRSIARQNGSSVAYPSSAGSINELYEAPVDGDATENVVITPGARFCHVGVVYDNAFYIFGGYDGANRLNDFLRFQFDQLEPCESEEHQEGSEGAVTASAASEISSPSSLIHDLRGYLNSELLSDIQFLVEGRIIYAHQMLCRRCPVFNSMFISQFRERDAECIPIPDVKYEIFLLLLEYLYTDTVTITMDTAMDLFQVADQYAIDRLKDLCEQKMLLAIDVDTAAHILLTADLHNAQNLREKCMAYILRNFDRVSVTASFEEMGRNNVELVFEVLRRRNQKK